MRDKHDIGLVAANIIMPVKMKSRFWLLLVKEKRSISETEITQLPIVEHGIPRLLCSCRQEKLSFFHRGV